MKKLLGDANKKAREQAVSALAAFKGRKVAVLNNTEIRDVLTALLQLLGLVDQDGNIK
jgi:hypothetical protein